MDTALEYIESLDQDDFLLQIFLHPFPFFHPFPCS